jgi:hypothetical protein
MREPLEKLPALVGENNVTRLIAFAYSDANGPGVWIEVLDWF